MIKSDDIDLTVERKFTSRIPFWRREDNALSRIRRPVYSSGRSISVAPRSTFLPWNMRPVQSEDFLDKQTRFKNDVLSSEYGEVLRLTYDNRLWQVTGKRMRYSTEVLEEFLMETIGGYPYYAVNKCFVCGKITISPYKEMWRYHTCFECSKGRIPWR